MKPVHFVIVLQTACGCKRMIDHGKVEYHPGYYYVVPLVPEPRSWMRDGWSLDGDVEMDTKFRNEHRLFEYRGSNDSGGVRFYEYVERRSW